MKRILNVFRQWAEDMERRQWERERQREEAYLAQATDIYDLERRSHELERRKLGSPNLLWPSV
jgi:hypothetical protein